MITEYYIKLIIIFLLVFYFGCNDNGQAPPPPFPQVSLSASSSSILVGESFTLDINVANIEALSYISFEILFDSSYLEVDRESGAITLDEDSEGSSGPYVFLDTLGVLSVALGGNNINGNIISFTIKGIQATVLETDNDGNAISDYTELQLDKEKINLIRIDGMVVSDLKITDLNHSIVRGVTITVTDE